MAGKDYGGYDYEFVDKVESKFLCMVCQKILREPILSGCCGQHCCDSCLKEWFTKKGEKSCPHCRELNFGRLLNKEKKREVEELRVFCRNSAVGCGWKDALGKLSHHLSSDKDDGCLFEEVDCNLMCGERMKRKLLSNHRRFGCVERPYRCLYCNVEGTYKTITGVVKTTPFDTIPQGSCDVKPPPENGHYAVCEHYPKPCPNDCGTIDIKRKSVHSHLFHCPRQPVNCTYRSGNKSKVLQCLLRMERRMLAMHQENECLYRPYTCQFCGLEDTHDVITGESTVSKSDPSDSQKMNIPVEKGHYLSCTNFPKSCPNSCGVGRIKRKNIASHREQCPLEIVECQHAGPNHVNQLQSCEIKMKRKSLSGHQMYECLYRKYSCEFCGLESTFTFITGLAALPLHSESTTEYPNPDQGHYAKCAKYQLSCPNSCETQKIERSRMADHLTVCPLQPVDCPFTEAGCQEKIFRKDLKCHVKENQIVHLALVTRSLLETRQEMKSLKREVSRSAKELNLTKSELTQTKRELSKTQDQMKKMSRGMWEEVQVVHQEVRDQKVALSQVVSVTTSAQGTSKQAAAATSVMKTAIKPQGTPAGSTKLKVSEKTKTKPDCTLPSHCFDTSGSMAVSMPHFTLYAVMQRPWISNSLHIHENKKGTSARLICLSLLPDDKLMEGVQTRLSVLDSATKTQLQIAPSSHQDIQRALMQSQKETVIQLSYATLHSSQMKIKLTIPCPDCSTMQYSRMESIALLCQANTHDVLEMSVDVVSTHYCRYRRY